MLLMFEKGIPKRGPTSNPVTSSGVMYSHLYEGKMYPYHNCINIIYPLRVGTLSLPHFGGAICGILSAK